MKLTRSFSVILLVCLMLFIHGCAYVGPTTGTDHAVVQGGKAYIMVSPSLTVTVPVDVAMAIKLPKPRLIPPWDI